MADKEEETGPLLLYMADVLSKPKMVLGIQSVGRNVEARKILIPLGGRHPRPASSSTGLPTHIPQHRHSRMDTDILGRHIRCIHTGLSPRWREELLLLVRNLGAGAERDL